MTADVSRRSFLRGHFLKSLQSEKVLQQGHNAIRPPWADLANFLENCTGCQQCISACEMQILVKGAGGYPEVDFQQGRGECSFCQACVKACDAPVFRPTTEQPWAHKVTIEAACLAFNGVECRRCEESCEPRAIRFTREIGGVAKPTLDLARCNGCGACISSCPIAIIKVSYQ